ncbi:hypothetical protein PMZ80_000781 [Knufia obscura]|uniref:DUF1772-domain-containing protein n=2 Tax=Knufia TaxID=430999 RepID=A0AAN8EEZ3_9EURO|nr:hypothetical protein PMZ80_000781 [Knufia obscura]KAK5949152.1 hypothetical protein OHC33_009893 [Knufia fluminis]
MATPTTAAEILSISTALLAAGGIATLSLFDVPELQSQPASRSLPSIRWLFSRGSHIFPTAAAVSSAGFLYLAYAARPATSLQLTQLLQHGRVPGYLAAAILTFSIGPVTSLMVPTNFRLIQMNEERGSARSEKSAKQGATSGGARSAEESVEGKGQASQFTDLSGPQGKAEKSSTQAEDEEVRELLGKFGRMNAGRAVLMAAGGIVGLATALA